MKSKKKTTHKNSPNYSQNASASSNGIQVSSGTSSRSYNTSSNTTSSSTSHLNATLISAAPSISHVVDSGKKRPAEHQLQVVLILIYFIPFFCILDPG